jgi:O-antigen/teichoic acid export membrane protein
MFFGLLAVMGDEVILLLFGPAWQAAVIPLQLGCISGVLWAPFMLHASLLTAKREVGWQLRIPLVAAPVLLVCLWLGSLHSLNAVAAWTVVASTFRLALIQRALKQGCGISIWAVIVALKRTAVASLLGVGTATGIKWLLQSQGAPVALILPMGLLAGAVAGGASAWALGHPLAAEARLLWQRRKSPAAG